MSTLLITCHSFFVCRATLSWLLLSCSRGTWWWTTQWSCALDQRSQGLPPWPAALWWRWGELTWIPWYRNSSTNACCQRQETLPPLSAPLFFCCTCSTALRFHFQTWVILFNFLHGFTCIAKKKSFYRWLPCINFVCCFLQLWFINQLMLVNDILRSTPKFVYFTYIFLVLWCCWKGDRSRVNLNSAAHLRWLNGCNCHLIFLPAGLAFLYELWDGPEGQRSGRR